MSALRVLGACVAALVAAVALADGKAQFGSAAEAKAMLHHAIMELKADSNAALGKFNDPAGGFRDRDLYVFCFDTTTGHFTAHPNKALLGTDNRLLKEKNGSPLGQKVYDAVQKLKDGHVTTVTYKYPRPGTTEEVTKVAYVTRVGGTGCGVGYYKD